MTSGMPLPRTRNMAPVAVPSGIFSPSVPSPTVWHLDLAAERQRGEVHRNLDRRGRCRHAGRTACSSTCDDDVEIARRSALRCRLRLRRINRRRCPVAIPAGILTVSLRICSVAPWPRQVCARPGDDAPAAAAFAAGARDGEESLLIAQLAGAAALRTRRRLRARRRARCRDRSRTSPVAESESSAPLPLAACSNVISRS